MADETMTNEQILEGVEHKSFVATSDRTAASLSASGVAAEDVARALQNKKTYDTWQQGFVQIFHAVRENKVFVMNVYRCVSREQVEKYLVPLTDQLIMGVIAERSAGMTVREEDKQFIAQVHSYSFVGLMLDWIKDDMRAEPELLVNKLALVIQGSISAALERFRTDKPSAF